MIWFIIIGTCIAAVWLAFSYCEDYGPYWEDRG